MKMNYENNAFCLKHKEKDFLMFSGILTVNPGLKLAGVD